MRASPAAGVVWGEALLLLLPEGLKGEEGRAGEGLGSYRGS